MFSKLCTSVLNQTKVYSIDTQEVHLSTLLIHFILSILCLCNINTHHQTPMTCTYGYNPFIHFKTGATEVEIQFLSRLMSLLAQFGSAFFSSKEGVPVLLAT